MSRKVKEIALQTVVLLMEQVRDNFANSATKGDAMANAEAMRILADAFKVIAGSR